jgi:hypothetical protein
MGHKNYICENSNPSTNVQVLNSSLKHVSVQFMVNCKEILSQKNCKLKILYHENFGLYRMLIQLGLHITKQLRQQNYH